MRSRLALAIVLAGCYRDVALGDKPSIDAPHPDAMAFSSDGGDATGVPAGCFGSTRFAYVCPQGFAASVTLSSTLDTDTGCSGAGIGLATTNTNSTVCAIAATDVTLADLFVTGSLPLAVIATDTIDVEGSLSLSSHATGMVGAGASAVACGGAAAGDGGGAGGSYQGLGGSGGSVQTVGGGTAGASQAAGLHAGCAGGLAAGVSTRSSGGGMSGGVVFLIAGDALKLDGVIDADGAGGLADMASNGGGNGGGAGGLIAIQAGSILQQGTLPEIVAEGGAGAGGNGVTGGSNGGSNGGEFELANCTPAVGGQAGQGAGLGGNGNSVTPPGLPGDSSFSAGGGGGGGGGGYVMAHIGSGSLPNCTVPTATMF